MSSALSACCPEGFPNIREAVRNAEASRIVCGRCGSPEERRDVLTMSAGQCRQSAEGVTKFISASKFCSGPKSRRGKFALSRRCRNARKRSGVIKTVKGIFQEHTDMLPNHAVLSILHSASCPGLVRALVDAWSNFDAYPCHSDPMRSWVSLLLCYLRNTMIMHNWATNNAEITQFFRRRILLQLHFAYFTSVILCMTK